MSVLLLYCVYFNACFTCAIIEPSCSSNQFKCNDGSCIDSAYRCDEIPDCNDRSDELNCDAGG